jgi:uncharacterized protein
MDQNERRVIDELFGKLRQVDGQAPSRDPEAEAHIRQQVAAMPAAPYYMAQAIVVQEQALANAQARVEELERRATVRPAGGGGFLGGLFGGGGDPAPAPRRPAMAPQQQQNRIPPGYLQQPGMAAGQASPWGRPAGGGFLAGAMQTAIGVAGGVLIANAIGSAFDTGTTEASDMAQDAGLTDEPAPDEAAAEDAGFQDAGFEDFGGDGGGFDDSI